MLDWRSTEADPAPKDRLILVTAGWGWRREDKTVKRPSWYQSKRPWPERTYKILKPIGAIVMVYWLEDKGHRDGGVWAIAGNDAAFYQPFRWWADVNNPLSPAVMAEHDPTFLVSNHRPELEAMTPYVPSKDEIRDRELRSMLGL